MPSQDPPDTRNPPVLWNLRDLEQWMYRIVGNAVVSTGSIAQAVCNPDGTVISVGGGGGTSATDSAAFTAGSSSFTPTGGVFNDSVAALTSGQQGTVRLTNNRAFHVNLRTAGGTEVALPTSLNADGGFQVHVINGGGGVSATDAAAWTAGSTVFTPTGGVFNDSATALTSGQEGTARVTNNRALHINIRNAGGTELSTASNPLIANVAQWGGTAVVTGGVAGTVGVGGLAASGATASGNPVMTGAVFNTTQPTVTNGQVVDLQSTARGGLIVSTGVDTFNVTVNAALPTGANTIGAVTQASGPWTSNITQIASNAISTAATGTILAGMADGAGNKLTTNSTTFASKFALDANLLGTLGTAFSTAGKVDVKGADGDVFVRQATAANLNATATQGPAAAGTAGWPVIAGNLAASTAAWNSGTGSNTAVTVTVTNYAAIGVGLNATSTMTGGVLTFEADDGSGTWFPIIGLLSDGSATNSTFNLAVVNKLWRFDVTAFTQFRVRLSTVITGTGTANLRVLTEALSDADVVAISAPLPAGSNIIGALSANQSVNIAQIAGTNTVTAAAGVQKVGIVGNANANIDAAAGTVATNTVSVVPTAPAAGGAGWQFKSFGDAGTNSGTTDWNNTKQAVVAGPATLGGWCNLYNPNTAVSWLLFYNKTTANVTVGTTPPDFIVTMPGLASASGTGSDRNVEFGNGIKFSTALTVAVVSTVNGGGLPANKTFGTILFN